LEMSSWSLENLIKRLVAPHIEDFIEICHEKSATRNSIVLKPIPCTAASRSS
jgi:hypothetical protein